jgi:GAF domain-containing protein
MTDELVEFDDGLRDLLALLVSDEPLNTTLHHVATIASRCINGTGASVTLLRAGQPYTAYATDERARSADDVQYDLREGPCLAALKSGEVEVIADDLATVECADFVTRVAAFGIRSMIGVPLVVNDEVLGSLNLYADSADAFGEDEKALMELLAGPAAVSVANARTHEECVAKLDQLQEALNSRVIIEQAKGVLMERRKLDPDAAFATLRDESQRSNRKLRVVATEVVTSVAAGR